MAVLIALQADMWDPAALPSPPNDGLNGYTGFVHELANLSLHFGRPVLLINGDSLGVGHFVWARGFFGW